ncbi:hypothetical protein CTAYLR_000455 [Chrysophaeum taylorii]|uniref:Uncharacterized protein n=1 Tax=Chrysophaeum taylorii TaxID=2483200 RepID=A0AAD7UHM4_9STRA|nr:hypothetical protein CTAYLR_000455 [Chrysophaeum taylorii]
MEKRDTPIVPPCSIAWTPIPSISWCLPFVGHLGIVDGDGLLHDWDGTPIHPNHPKDMLFGEPARYVVLARDPAPAEKERWNQAIAQADYEFSRHPHCIGYGYDCHSHVARALNLARYLGCTYHNKILNIARYLGCTKVFLAFAVFFAGHYVSVPRDLLRVWVPPLVMLPPIVIVCFFIVLLLLNSPSE